MHTLTRRGTGNPTRALALMALGALIACTPRATREPGEAEAAAAAEPPAATAEQATAEAAVEQAPVGTEQAAESMVLTGTIRYLDLEGGLYVIESGGTNYNPMELPQEFQIDGLPVEVELRQRNDVAGIGMAGPMVEIIDIRERQPDVPEGEAPAPAEGDPEDLEAGPAETTTVADATLWGSAWRLEDLGGRTAMSGVEVTLEFPDQGRAVGNASCNRFFGQVAAEGNSISFRDLGTMRMACAPGINEQEQRFLDALGTAERYEIEEPYLRIFGGEEEQPLRFVRVEG